MTLEKALFTLELLAQSHIHYSENMKEFANKPGRTFDMKEIGLILSQNHESLAKVLKAVVKDLRNQEEASKKKSRKKKKHS